MINYLGKGLVLVTMAVSGIFLAWAIAVYTQTIDWGWKDPRKELAERVPSEIDKRLVAVQDAVASKARAQVVAKEAADNLAVAEQDYDRNVLLFRAKLAELKSGEGKIKVVELKHDKGILVRNEKRATAAPVFEGVVPGAEKSTAGYLADFNKLQADLVAVTAKIDQAIKQESVLTIHLNGVKGVKPGMYELLEKEKKMQDELQEGMEKVQPLWVRELVDAQLLLARTGRLDQRLAELQQPSRKQ